MSELPRGWIKTTLDQIAQWGSGGTPSRRDPANFGGTIPWIKTGELGQRLVNATEENISERGLSGSSAKLFPPGSVAIAMYGATIGKTSILGIEAATNQACAVAIPDVNIATTEYLYHYLCSQRDAFVDAGKGGAQPNISQSVLKAWPAPLPPLPEQKRIADKLDRLLARVDACRERLDRVPALLKRFRQSILAAATSGELTREWREERGIGLGDWKTVKLHGICESIADGDHQAPPKAAAGIPFITISAINSGELRLDQATRFVPESYYQSLRPERRAQPGDILYSVTGSIGIAALVETSQPFVFQRHIAIIRPRTASVTERFLRYRLMADDIKQQALAVATGTAQLTIPLGGLRSFSLPLPDIAEQLEITRRIESAFATISMAELSADRGRSLASALTQSALAKAFRGELVPQDPTDEPAAALLARVAAVRDDAGAPARRGRRKATPSEFRA